MPTKYRRLIERYCERSGITIPSGFARNTANRYAMIRTDVTPPKLVATTWRKAEDVVYYIEHFLLPELGNSLLKSVRILDFKQGDELLYRGSKRLDRVAKLAAALETKRA